VSFGEADARLVCDQRAVIEFGRGETEDLVEQQLASGRFKQVLATDNFGDGHGGIVDDNGELIGGEVIVTPNDEIPEIAAGDEMLWAKSKIDEGNGFAIRNLKTPIDRGGITVLNKIAFCCPAGAGINWFVLACVRCL
jgi:hypothetical protein